MITESGTWKTLPGLDYTSKQLFWITYARGWCYKYWPGILEVLAIVGWPGIHSPTTVRVNGVLQNTEEFSKDFNCPRGRKMNPEKKCPRIW